MLIACGQKASHKALCLAPEHPYRHGHGNNADTGDFAQTYRSGRHRNVFQKNTLCDGCKMPQRIQLAGVLQKNRHIHDRSDRSGNKNAGNTHSKCAKKRLLLRSRKRRHHKPDPARGCRKYKHCRIEQQHGTCERHTEAQYGNKQEYGSVYHAHKTARHQLCQSNFRRYGGRNQQLVESPHLTLPRYGKPRHDQPQHETQHAYKVGQKKPLKLKIGIMNY